MFTVIATYPPPQEARAFGPFTSWEAADAYMRRARTHAHLKKWSVRVHVAAIRTPTMIGIQPS